MGVFFEWMAKRMMAEGMPAGWEPSPQLAHDPFTSALEKIQRNVGQMPFNGNFQSSDAMMVRLGLSRPEFEALLRAQVLVHGPEGWNVHQGRFMRWFLQVRGFAPSLTPPMAPPAG